MSTEWMGRYRHLVGALVRHTNLRIKGTGKSRHLDNNIEVNASEWQVLEYVIEHSFDDDRMIHISDTLGIPQSSFSKIVSKLCAKNLVEKYQAVNNKKNVILKATRLGEELYRKEVNSNASSFFSPFFEELDKLDDETLAVFTKALNLLSDNYEKDE